MKLFDDATLNKLLLKKNCSKCLRNIKSTLPELLSKNTLFAERLNSKLSLGSFLNDTEVRNNNYLRYYLFSSDKILQKVKRGFDLANIIDQNKNNLSILNQQANNDCFIKNRDFFIQEKNLINKKIPEQTNIDIPILIKKIRQILNPPPEEIKIEHKIINSTNTNRRILDAEKLLNSELNNDKNIINEKIKDYIDSFNNNQRAKINITKDVRMINYKKIVKQPLKEKEIPNKIYINKVLFPQLFTSKSREKSKNARNFVNIYNCNSVKNIHNFNIFRKYSKSSGDIGNSQYTITNNNSKEKDSYNIIRKIANKNKDSKVRMNIKYNQIGKLIDVKLPDLKDYDNIILSKKKQKNNNNYINNNSMTIDLKHKNNKIYKEFLLLKKEISEVKNKKLHIQEIYDKNNKNINYLFHKNNYIKFKRKNFMRFILRNVSSTKNSNNYYSRLCKNISSDDINQSYNISKINSENEKEQFFITDKFK